MKIETQPQDNKNAENDDEKRKTTEEEKEKTGTVTTKQTNGERQTRRIKEKPHPRERTVPYRQKLLGVRTPEHRR